jgi:hypothetical protein
MRIFLCLAIFTLLVAAASGQDISGKWYGKLTQGPGGYSELYSLDLDLTQSKQLGGESYAYMGDSLDVRIGLSGSIDGDKVRLKEYEDRILKEVVPVPWIICIKKFFLTYRKEGNREYLQGDWTGWGKVTEHVGCPINNPIRKWTRGEENIYLRDSLSLSRINDNVNTQDCFPDSISGGGRCIPGDIILARSKEDLEVFFANGGFNNPIPASSPIESPIPVFTPDFHNTEIKKVTEIVVNHPSLQIRLYDYLRIDNDTVSVYLNRDVLAKNIRVSKQAVKLDFKLDTRIDLNEILLFAENLGQVPPNTSLIEIIDGSKKYRLKIESDKQKTAGIYLRYKPRNQIQNE